MANVSGSSREQLNALDALCAMSTVQHDYTAAAQYSETFLDLARKMKDREATASALLNQASVKLATGDLRSARNLVDEADCLRISDSDGFNALYSNRIRGVILALTGHLDEARPLLEEGVRLGWELGYLSTIPFDLAIVGAIALAQGDVEAARTSALRGLELCKTYGSRRDAVYCLDLYAGVAATEGRSAHAVLVAGASAAIKDSSREAPPAVWQSIAESWLEPAERALGEDATSARASGRELSLREILDAVLPQNGAGVRSEGAEQGFIERPPVAKTERRAIY
jgi:tetratricopeptide (TPR) repeat protein